MALLRLQNMTPPVYTEESRDFQLLCRLYDCVINGIKFDTDNITKLLDARFCRTSFLELLQTKLGFYTKQDIDDNKLRYVLESFPTLVKNKGSILAIKEAVFLFLRMYSASSNVRIAYYKKATVVSDGSTCPDHTLVIELKSFSTRPDTTVLEEIFKYILPTGVDYYILFVTEFSDTQSVFNPVDSATLLFVSDIIGSQVRGSDCVYDFSDSFTATESRTDFVLTQPAETIVGVTVNGTAATYTFDVVTSTVTLATACAADDVVVITYDTAAHRLINAVDTVSTISTDSVVNSAQFIGYYTADPVSTTDYAVAIVNSVPKIYVNGGWKVVSFLGSVEEEPTITADDDGSLIYLLGDTPVYELAINGSWIDYSNYARYILQTYGYPQS